MCLAQCLAQAYQLVQAISLWVRFMFVITFILYTINESQSGSVTCPRSHSQDLKPESPTQTHTYRHSALLAQKAIGPVADSCVSSVASRVSVSAAPRTAASQAPLSMGFSRQHWSGLPYLPPGIFPIQRSKSHLLCLPHCRWILYY